MWGFFSSSPSKNFPFEISDQISGLEGKSLWKLHKGKKKANGDLVSIFIFDIKANSEAVVQLASCCFKRVKTLRHPYLLTYIDGLETEKVLYIVTEPVVPLATYLGEGKHNDLSVSWGLYTISTALSFLVNDCSTIHNNVCLWSVYVNRAGDWLLGGLEFASHLDPNSSASSIIKTLPDLEKYDPPEKLQAVVRGAKWAIDSWGLGCLIWEVFNGALPRSSSLKALGKIPKSLVASYCELVGANPKSRPNPSLFLENCRLSSGFMNNSFINTMLFLEEIQLKDQTEKNNFFQKLTPTVDSFPAEICRHRLLPQLLNAFEFGNAGSTILAPLLKVGKMLEAAEYQKMVIPCVVKLFSSPDRNTRVKLLQQIETFVEHLPVNIVNDQIFPHVVQGFADSNPVVRETTIKATIHLARKLNYKNLNEELMKYFAHLQSKDEQGGIRTNTTICLGKIAGHLHPAVRLKVLLSAFTRATRDPFPPARQAGVLAMGATQNYYYVNDIATKILPILCTLTVDVDKSVRVQAFKAIRGFVEKLESVSEDPSLKETMEVTVRTGGAPVDGVAGWAGWAVSGMSALTSKLYRSKSDKPEKQVSETNKVSSPEKPNKVTSEENTIDSNDEVTTDVDDGWGDMDDTEQQVSTVLMGDGGGQDEAEAKDDFNDWDVDDEDWGSLETFQPHQTRSTSRPSQLSTTSSYFSESDSATDFFSQLSPQKAPSKPDLLQSEEPITAPKCKQHQQIQKPVEKTPPRQKIPATDPSPTVWGDSDWGDLQAWGESDLVPGVDAKKINRDARRRQRQEEILQKREQRKGSAMKLGSKNT